MLESTSTEEVTMLILKCLLYYKNHNMYNNPILLKAIFSSNETESVESTENELNLC